MSDLPVRALLDTSVVVDLNTIPPERLPRELRISAITLAELYAGPAGRSVTPAERMNRLATIQRTEVAFDPLPFGVAAARASGLIYAAIVADGRQSRGRLADLLIAAVALAEGLPLMTRNPTDFAGLDNLITIIAV